MIGFKDIYLPAKVVGWPTSGAPRWSTTVIGVASGAEQRNQNWAHPLHRYNLAEAVRSQDTFENLKRHWLAMRGPFYTFPFKDPLDFASTDLPAANFEPAITGADVLIGTGDGLTTTFQLVKYYGVSGLLDSENYTRNITLPVLASVLILMDGLAPDNVLVPGGPYSYTITRPGGVVTFDPAPHPDIEAITAGFLFDVPVRFETDDSFEGIARTYRVSGFADLPLIETRPC